MKVSLFLTGVPYPVEVTGSIRQAEVQLTEAVADGSHFVLFTDEVGEPILVNAACVYAVRQGWNL